MIRSQALDSPGLDSRLGCMTAQPPATLSSLEKDVGRCLAHWRASCSLRQEDVASLAFEVGLRWSATIVAAIEGGTRRVTAGELLLIPRLTGRGLAEFMCPEAGSLRIPNVGSFTQSVLREYLYSGIRTGPWTKRDIVPADRPAVLPVTGAERKAAARLGVSLAVLNHYSHQRWGRSLSQERDAQVNVMVPNLSERGLQAHRGLVTRRLVGMVDEDIVRAKGAGLVVRGHSSALDDVSDDARA
jgi:hypothetical protein